MCGLVGMAGDLGIKERDVMKDLLFLNSLRGKDSTGVATVSRRREVDLRKMTIPGYEFIDQGFINQLLTSTDQLWLGHGRFKTVGTVSKANAHPFWVYDKKKPDVIVLAGAHNGTLSNKWEIENLLDKESFGTDSEALLNLISKMGVKDAIAEARGAWAITYWDPYTDSINFIRNKERPLYYAMSENQKTLFWASEAWMIYNACARNDVKLLLDDKGISIRSFAEDHHYCWAIPQKYEVFEAPVRQGGVVGKPDPVFQGRSQYAANDYRDTFWKKLDEEAAKREEEGKKQGEKTEEKGEKEVITIGNPPQERVVQGHNGKPLKESELKKLIAAGCVFCGDAFTNGYGWADPSSPVCKNCVNGSHKNVVSDQVKSIIGVK